MHALAVNVDRRGVKLICKYHISYTLGKRSGLRTEMCSCAQGKMTDAVTASRKRLALKRASSLASLATA